MPRCSSLCPPAAAAVSRRLPHPHNHGLRISAGSRRTVNIRWAFRRRGRAAPATTAGWRARKPPGSRRCTAEGGPGRARPWACSTWARTPNIRIWRDSTLQGAPWACATAPWGAPTTAARTSTGATTAPSTTPTVTALSCTALSPRAGTEWAFTGWPTKPGSPPTEWRVGFPGTTGPVSTAGSDRSSMRGAAYSTGR